jgi:hypothetical protein
MAKRYGQAVHLGSKRVMQRKEVIADGIDFDVF